MDDRCFWVPPEDPLYRAYHDDEWGFPVAEDRRLFEKLCLEAFQAGLSWRTILGKRDAFRDAFDGFDMAAVADFGGDDLQRLLHDDRIVRNRAKIEASIVNARVALDLVESAGSLAAHIWGFEPDVRQRPDRVTEAFVRDTTASASSVALARDLKERGWRFIGPTTAYAFMQSVGLVNDHTESCVVRPRVAATRERFTPPA